MALKIRLKIDGVDRQDNLLETEWVIDQNAHGKLDHATFVIDDPTNAISLSRGKEVIIEAFADSNDRRFGGILTEVTGSTHGLGRRFACKALDWTFLLDRALVNEKYRGKSDQFIIADATDGIFKKSETDLLGFGFTVTTARVQEGNSNTQFLQFKRNTIRNVMDTLKDFAGQNFVWYVDPFKTVVFEVIGTTGYTFHLSDSPDDVTSFAYMDFKQLFSITKIVNEVTVEGSFLRELFADLDSATTVREGDGAKTLHLLGALWQASTGNERIKIFRTTGPTPPRPGARRQKRRWGWPAGTTRWLLTTPSGTRPPGAWSGRRLRPIRPTVFVSWVTGCGRWLRQSTTPKASRTWVLYTGTR